MNRYQLRNLSWLTLAMVATPALVAQESTGQLVGSVKTKEGTPIAGATLRLSSPNLQGVRQVTTDDRGGFRAPLLPPGQYTVVVHKDGFFFEKATLDVSLGQIVRHEILGVKGGQASAVVEVIAAAASVDKSDVKASTTLSSELLDQMPRSTRGMDTAALLTPGVVLGVGSRVQIRGGQTTQNRFLLNGTDIADNVFGNTSGRNFYVDDSIQETQVIQSPVHARYGGFTGGVINAITRTGSNEFSGIFRSNLSRASWSAQTPRGMRPNIIPANAGTGVLEDSLDRAHTIWIGGPILKDRLWFAFSTKLQPNAVAPNSFDNLGGLTTGDGSGAAAYIDGNNGGPFAIVTETKFYEMKFTWAINANHTLELAGNTNSTPQVNRYYVATIDPATLVPQDNENDYKTLAYRGIFGGSLTTEVRWAKKHQLLSAGGDPAKGDPIRARYSNGGYYIFNNGIFDKTDGGDNRDITTLTGNVTWFSPETALGQFTIDAGFENLVQDRQAANAQTPTGRQFLVWGRNADGTYRVSAATATARSQNYVNLYSVDKGTAKSTINATYLNALWALNKYWQFNLGGRLDSSKAEDTLGSQTISSSRFSPRFQGTWDIKGDQAWLVRGSYARYTGKLNDSFTNRFTRAGNPVTESYRWGQAPNTAASFATVTNLANWDVTAAGLIGYSGPLNRFVDPKTKAPYNDEVSIGIRHNYKDGSYIGLTYNKRQGGGFFNDFFNIKDEVNAPLTYVAGLNQLVVAERWATDESLTRNYKGLEFDFLFKLNSKWDMGGNWTYASLTGNGEASEGNNPPVSGDIIGDYTSVHESRGRDLSYYAPEGYLAGDVRHRMRMYLGYNNRSAQGAGFYGSLLFNYDGGASYSLTRALTFEAQTDAAAGTPSAIVGQYPTSYTRFFGPRGLGRFNDTFNFDLKVGVEMPLFWRMRWFGEITVANLFNHWQLASYSTTSTTGTGILTSSPLSGYRANALTVAGGNANGYGTYGGGNYVGGRSVVLSTGFKW